MIGMTLCSGIGAPEVAAPWVDWRLASEIEPFPRAVLQERFGYLDPETHNQGEPLLWGDMTEVTPDLLRSRGIPLPELIVAGTPCQAFSIAGLRKGVEDARGNLTLKFVEICHAIVDARPDGELSVVWENVPGVLSDKDNAFGCFLGGLVGAVDALPSPGDGSWPSEGMVQGPRARAAWCALDAQFFGVAQRRRRVFVVVDFGGRIDPAKILLEPDRLRGDTPPSREAGQGVAGTLSARTKGGGGLGTDFELACGLQTYTKQAIGEYSGLDVSSTLSARDYKDATDLVVCATGEVSHTLTGEGFDAFEDGSGRGTPTVAYSIMPMNSGKDYKARETDVAQPLMAGGPVGGNQGGDYVVGTKVRRLMPVECSRLQGFADNHCDVKFKGKPATDGHKYKALGNSMAVPVMKWILDRVKQEIET